jgi:cell division protein FtsQ
MARKSASTISQEELYPVSDGLARDEIDDARMLDLDTEQESPFLRGQKRVSVRRGALPKKAATRLLWGGVAFTIFAICLAGVAAIYQYGEHSWRFRVESSDHIDVADNHNVTRAQVIEVMGGDIGRNIFFVPLDQRKQQLEQIPWVESASVMRFVPNRLRVEIHERTPVAFIRVGSKIMLTDQSGALMELPFQSKTKYSFPVIVGANAGEPLSLRAARMKIYSQLTSELDSDGGHYSQGLSEVDLSDPDDVTIVPDDTLGDVFVHLGSSNFLDRYKIYISHVREWRQQFSKLDSVDLRYDGQVVVNPATEMTMKQPSLSPAVLRDAKQAGVKPASLLTKQSVIKSGAKPVANKATHPAGKKSVKAAAHHKSSAKTAWHKPVANGSGSTASNATANPPVSTAEVRP